MLVSGLQRSLLLTVKDVQAILAVTVNEKICVFWQPLLSAKEVRFHAVILGLQSEMDLRSLRLRRTSLSPTTTKGTQTAV